MDHADIFFPRYGKMATISSPLKMLLLVLCSVTLCHASSTAETSAATTAAMTTVAATTAAATTTATPVVCKIDNITQADRTETSLTFDFAVSQGGTGHCKDIQICIDPNNGSEHCVNKTGEATGTVIFSGLFSGRLYTVNITVTDSTNGAESLNTAARTYPKPPEQVSVKATTTESITLEFTPPSDTEFNFYLIEYGGVSENISKTTETEITGLQPGNVYDFTVQTVSWGLEGVNSTSVTGLTLPDPPQKPEIISVKETTITVNWSSPVGNHDSITVSCVGQSGASSNTVTVGNDTREATCTSLTPGALYSVTLVATYGGEQSTNVTADPESAVTIPLAVEDVMSQTLDTTSIVVNFTHLGDPAVSQCSSFVIHYQANHSEDVLNVETACTTNRNSYSEKLMGLNPNAFYTINITTRSKPDKDNSTKSSTTQPETSAWTLPNPTGDLTLSDIGSRWIQMNIAEVSEQPTNVAFYALHVSNATSVPNQCVKQVVLLVSGALTDFPTSGVSCSADNCPESSSEIYTSPYNLTELRPYINHTMTVVVVNPGGCSKPTQPLTSLTSQDVPGPVSTFTAIADAYYIDISWSHPEERNGILTNYTIVRCEKNTTTPDCGEVCQTHTVLPENTTYHIDLLNPAHCYNITIAASTSIGMGPTELIDQSCTKTGKPPTPEEVISSVDGPYDISVTWTYFNCTRATGLIRYNVSAKADKNVEQLVTVEGFENTFTVIQNLRPYVKYEVCVLAFTLDGDDTLLADEKCGEDVTTEQAASGPVSDFEVKITDEECYNLKLTWNSPETPNGLITSYGVEYKKKSDADWVTKNFSAVAADPQEGTIECADPNNQEYDLKIIPINGAGGGASEEISGVTGVCPPKELTEPSATASSQSKTSFTVELNKCQLCKNLNGDLKFAGIILSETKTTDSQEMTFSDQEALDAQFKTYDDYDPKVGYRTTPDDWLQSLDCDGVTGCGDDVVCQETGRMRRAADPFQFVIGEDNSCEPNTYCNKQLGKNKDSRNFRIRLVVGTDGGFYVTKFVDDVFTTDKFMAWIAGPVIASVVVIVAIILLVIFLRKKNIGPFREKQKTRSARLSANDDFSNAFTNQAMALDEPLIEKPLPIDINNFEQYVREHSRDSDLLFAEEYKLIQELAPKHPSEASEHPNNRLKNRFTNILPFDHSRVKLLPADDDDCSDYINANYMPGYNSKREFIASQGPMKSTVEDFWRMIWEQNVAIIVMVTQLEERGRERCAKYWPNDNEPMYYGDLQVQMRSESVLDSYVIRILDVRLGEIERTMKQMHFIRWPDFGVPENPETLLDFIADVRMHTPRGTHGPILVHCSAGVGRTGSFIAVDRLLQHIQDHDTFSVFDVVMEMRNQRCYMIQVEAQYILIHKCILAAIKRGLYRKNNFRQSQPDDPIYANAGFEPPEAIYENAMPHQQVAEGRV